MRSARALLRSSAALILLIAACRCVSGAPVAAEFACEPGGECAAGDVVAEPQPPSAASGAASGAGIGGSRAPTGASAAPPGTTQGQPRPQQQGPAPPKPPTAEEQAQHAAYLKRTRPLRLIMLFGAVVFVLYATYYFGGPAVAGLFSFVFAPRASTGGLDIVGQTQLSASTRVTVLRVEGSIVVVTETSAGAAANVTVLPSRAELAVGLQGAATPATTPASTDAPSASTEAAAAAPSPAAAPARKA